jgi:FtsH-binding integral membrane protein
MAVFGYLAYSLVAFTCYMFYILDFELFKSAVLPWIVFMIVLFAPLVWTAVRNEKASK